MTGVIGSYIANSPAPILVVQPTSDDARDYETGDVEQTFAASPALRELLSDDADETGRSTMLSRKYPGGSLKFLAAKSPRNLRRHTAKILLLDEIDGYEVGQEGDPIALAEMRTLTFRDRKIIAGSTPIFDYGPATRLYQKSDQRIFEVRCPSCDEYSEVKWVDITWEDSKPEAAHWICPKNGCVVFEKHKPQMVSEGRWRATAPNVKGQAGFKVNALVSPHHNARWGKLAAEFLEAKKSPETLQTFVNLVLGEPWKTEREDLDESELYERREPFCLANIPEETVFLTVGVDCQDDRLEAVIVGHGRSEVFILDHRVFWGPVDGDTVWCELDSLLRETWKHPRGDLTSIDVSMRSTLTRTSLPIGSKVLVDLETAIKSLSESDGSRWALEIWRVRSSKTGTLMSGAGWMRGGWRFDRSDPNLAKTSTLEGPIESVVVIYFTDICHKIWRDIHGAEVE